MSTNINKGKQPPKSPGRPKGVPNKVTGEVKTMILEALEGLGGAAYLMDKAESHPAAFMALVGKVMPLQVTGANGGAIVFENIVREIVKPK